MLSRLGASTKVALVATVLALAGVFMFVWTPVLDTVSTDPLVLVPFTVAFFACEAAVFHVEIRRQAHTFSLGEVVLVIGLFLVHPALLALARAGGGGLALTWRRQARLKMFFNLSLFTAEVAVAGLTFGLIASSGTPIMKAIGAIAAVGVADLVGVAAVWTAIAIFEGRPRRRQVYDVLVAQLLVTAVAGSVGVVGAIALEIGLWTAGFLVVFGAGAVAVFRTYASVTGRYTSLQTLHDFSRAIADDLDYRRVLVQAVSDLGVIVSATDVVVVSLQSSRGTEPGIFRHVGDSLEHEPLHGETELWSALGGVEPRIHRSSDLAPAVLQQLGISEGQVLSGDLVMADDYRLTVVATKTAESVGRFDETSIEQLGSVLRYVTATAKNGLMVEEIERASRHDALTGLANRSELERHLRMNSERCSVDVVVIAVEDFAGITDSLGHDVGDDVLQILGRRVVEAAPDAHLIARLDGASFAVLYQGLADGDVVRGVPQLLASVDGDVPTTLSRVDVRCGAGVARSADGTDAIHLVRWADLALSEARRSGATIGAYSPALDDAQQRRIRLVGDLRRAIGSCDFEVWYQPKMSLATGEVTGSEALIRWNHPLLGAVRPDEFIPLAETTGTIRDVTDFVLRTVVEQAAEWIDAGAGMEVAVNLSALDLVDEDLAPRISHLLRTHGVAASSIGLEVTETAIMRDEERVIANLARLRAAGHRIYVDDYGTGQSSLAYLKSLPIDALKIDRAFVTELGTNAIDEIIVSSTVELAHSLGLSVVAEGIEGRVAFERLRELGCEYAQGYFLARPMKAGEFGVWLADVPTLRALLGFTNTEAGAAAVAPDARGAAHRARLDTPAG